MLRVVAAFCLIAVTLGKISKNPQNKGVIFSRKIALFARFYKKLAYYRVLFPLF